MWFALVVLGVSVSAPGSHVVDASRADAAFKGLQAYFFDDRGSIWKSCGQNGGLGHAPSSFECKCESGPFCKNCYRWWNAVAVQSLITWSQAMPSAVPRNETIRLIETMRAHSPYTTRADPAWGYIDDYLWYVLLWMDVYEWLGDAKDLEEAVSTLELSVQARPSLEG